MVAKDTVALKQFPVVVSSECPNICNIHPLKQEQVSLIFRQVASNEIVRRLIVFGSAVTGKCHVGSDLDICIDADVSDGIKVYELQKKIGEICNWNCDILIYSCIGNRLRNTIDAEGVVVFE